VCWKSLWIPNDRDMNFFGTTPKVENGQPRRNYSVFKLKNVPKPLSGALPMTPLGELIALPQIP